MDQAQTILEEVFGYDSFRPHQREIVDALAGGRDVLAVMPTSAGKSLCYQIPALMAPESVAVVVSPLISLMADQVAALTESGVRAAYLNSTLSPTDQVQVLASVEEDLTLLYVAPERLGDPRLQGALRRRGVSVVAVDEAHCISQWGSDFRPDYLNIHGFIDALGSRPPVAALTATATATVRDAIKENLGLRDPLSVLASFDRPNLSFEVRRPTSEKDRLRQIVAFAKEHRRDSGIVYCATRKQVERTWEALRAAGIRAGRYHGGLDEGERTREQDDFIHDRTSVVVATNAFGMGIDKPDVAYVLHGAAPQSLEAYYQEAGRAGRDGSAARCILFYRDADLSTSRFLIEHSREGQEAVSPELERARPQGAYARLGAMEAYGTGEGCLREALLAYFGEEGHRCGEGDLPCGHCQEAEAGSTVERKLEAQKALACVARLQRMGRCQTKSVVAAILKGSTEARIRDGGFMGLSTHGILSTMAKDAIVHLLDVLRERGLLAQTIGAYPELYLTEEGLAFMKAPRAFPMAAPKGLGKAKSQGLAVFGGGDAGESADGGLVDLLKEVRRGLAGDKPAYIVASNATLEAIAAARPHSLEELLGVKGIGRAKADRYGEEFLRAIRHWELAQGR